MAAHRAVFNPVAHRSERQPLVDFLHGVLRERGITPVELCLLIYGRSASGKVLGAGQVYPMLKGEHLPTQPTIERWQAKGIDMQPVVGQIRAAMPKPLTPVRAAVAKFEEAVKVTPESRPESRRVAPPLFALNIDQAGQANVTLNLLDVSAEEALRCMSVLTAANLIKVRS